MYLIKLNNNGKLDLTFGKNGKILINNLLNRAIRSSGNTIYIDKNEKIYIAGNVYSNKDNSNIYIVKLKNDKKLDNSFKNNGLIVIKNKDIIGKK